MIRTVLLLLFVLSSCDSSNSDLKDSTSNTNGILHNFSPRYFCSSEHNKYGRLDGGGVVFVLDCIVTRENGIFTISQLLVDSGEYVLGEGQFSCIFIRERLSENGGFEEYYLIFRRDGIGKKTTYSVDKHECNLL